MSTYTYPVPFVVSILIVMFSFIPMLVLPVLRLCTVCDYGECCHYYVLLCIIRRTGIIIGVTFGVAPKTGSKFLEGHTLGPCSFFCVCALTHVLVCVLYFRTSRSG